ncbi:MAG: substrate-binding domain-containing protein [Gammaproteobacteria bacterium]|nr:substrate-binding domain-containing protein [Gammaproteobacteria bacterium]
MVEVRNEFIVMTSGAFTAAHLALLPGLEQTLGAPVVTATTSVGTGDSSIENRLKRGERADLVIVTEGLLGQFVDAGLVRAEGCTPVASSSIALAVRDGAPVPDLSSVEALRQTLLGARCVAYSASVSGRYLTTELYQRLGIAEQMLPRSRFVGGGERTGAVVARGEADIAVQQLSELLPVAGIAHITPLPAEVQKVSRICAGIGANASDPARSRAAIDLLVSSQAAEAIRGTGLEPLGAG